MQFLLCYNNKKKIFKFKSINYINVLFYQKYAKLLENLIAVQEAIIAQTHSIILIIKLKPNDFGLNAYTIGFKITQ